MKRTFSRLLLLAVLVGVALVPYPIFASPAKNELTNISCGYLYGEWINFTMGLPVDINAEQATLTIQVGTRQPISFEVPIVDRVARYETTTGALNVPAYSTITYWWEVAGTPKATSEYFSFRYDDNRFAWETVGSENVAIFWLNGDQEYMQTATHFAEQAMATMENDLDITFKEHVDIYIYPTPNDLQNALGLGQYKWVGGMSFPEMDVIAISILPTDEAIIDMKRSIPHELMHKALYELAGENGYDNLPVWFIEGLATSAEQSPNVNYTLALEEAVRQHQLIPLESLCSRFPTDYNELVLSYAESQSFMRFVQQNYGWPSIRTLVQVYRDGYGCAQGVGAVTGKSLSELESVWQSELAERTAASPNPTPVIVIPGQTDVNRDVPEILIASALPWLLIGGVMVVPVLVVLLGALRKRG